MWVISHALHWHGATGGWEFGGAAEYVAVYWAETDSKLDQVAIVAQYFHQNVKALGSHYAYGNDVDLLATLDSIRPRRTARMTRWEVTLHYTTPKREEGEDEDGNRTDDPLQFRDEIETGFTSRTRPVERATFRGGFKGTALALYPVGTVGPVVNSAIVPYIPPLEFEARVEVIRITKHRADYPDGEMGLVGAINAQNWTIKKPAYNFNTTFQKYHAQLADLVCSFDIRNDVRFWRVTFEIHHDPHYSFREEVLTAGCIVER